MESLYVKYANMQLEKMSGPWSICICNNLIGVVHESGVMIIPPILDKIKYGVNGGIEIGKGKKAFEIILQTYGEGIIGIFYLGPNGHRVPAFMGLGGDLLFSFDEDWYKRNHFSYCGLFYFVQGFINGIATVCFDHDETITEIKVDKTGAIVEIRCNLKYDDSIDLTDHMNWDGYDLYESGLYVDEEEQMYRDTFEDDPGAESNIL